MTFVIERHITPHPRTKPRTIEIIMDNLYKEIDSFTYKYADAATLDSVKKENAISSDSTEGLDAHLLTRNIEMRDARLRQILQSALADEVVLSTDDNITDATKITYSLALPLSFKDSLLKSLTTYIHRYLAWGALFDWYGAGIGSNQAKVYRDELESLEVEISNLIHSDYIAKKPMQPFGPAKFPM